MPYFKTSTVQFLLKSSTPSRFVHQQHPALHLCNVCTNIHPHRMQTVDNRVNCAQADMEGSQPDKVVAVDNDHNQTNCWHCYGHRTEDEGCVQGRERSGFWWRGALSVWKFRSLVGIWYEIKIGWFIMFHFVKN